jgi:hypothetical protein
MAQPTPCPAASHGRYTKRVMDAMLASDELQGAMPDGPGRTRTREQHERLCARFYELMDEAGWKRAETAEGALYSIVAANNIIAKMMDFDIEPEEQEKLNARLQRLLYSARNGIERAAGLDADTMTGSYLMAKRGDPFTELENAITCHEE